MKKFLKSFLSFAIVSSFAMAAGAAPSDAKTVLDAAVCKPPYSLDSSLKFYESAERMAKRELVDFIAVYKLKNPITSKDGLKTQALVVANNSYGILLDGSQAEALAARFQLKPERRSVLRAAIIKGYSRALAEAEQPSPETGVVSLAVREIHSFPGKTMLICEMLTHSEIKALQSY